jgi:hypothetical protein
MCFLEQTVISVLFIAGTDFRDCRVSDATTLCRDEIVFVDEPSCRASGGRAKAATILVTVVSSFTAIKTFLCWPLLLEGF